MKTKNKRIWMVVALVVVVVAGLTAALMWDKAGQGPPQIVTLPNGQKTQFVSATYGTKHVMGSFAARLVNRLPATARDFVRKLLGNQLGPVTEFQTGTPSLCVWFQPLGTNPTSMYSTTFCQLADDHDVAAGTSDFPIMQNPSRPLGVFEIVPRRSRVLQLCFYEVKPGGKLTNEFARVRFPNPVYGHYPQWQPESLPVVKQAGDVEVRLNDFMTGHRLLGEATSQGYYNGVETGFEVAVSAPNGNESRWVIQNAIVSDPGGNALAYSWMVPSFRFMPYLETASDGKTFGLTPMTDAGGTLKALHGTLWPDEAAWRLKVELKHTAKFAAAELVTFTNVPVPLIGSRVGVPITNTMGGMEIVLYDFVRSPAAAYEGSNFRPRLTIVLAYISGQPGGVAVDLVRMVTDGGEEIPITGNRWRPDAREADLAAIPTNAQTVNITWAVQKMRSVEFFVKPPKVE